MTPETRPSALGTPRHSASVGFPAGLASLSEGPYVVRFARDEEDLVQVLRLRFEVFNRELGEGLAESWHTGLDRDRFDAVCHHLLLVEAASGAVVGTYRLQTAEQARAGAGLYCADEFDLEPLSSIVARGVELGRACIAREHRQGTALLALWRGLAGYLAWSRKRYLFGCCSLTSQDPRAGIGLFRWLEREGHLHADHCVDARPAYVCRAGPSPEEVEVELPKLFGTYLRHGAKVVSQPALDRSFGTIDYLVLLDARSLPARLWRLFFARHRGSPEDLAG